MLCTMPADSSAAGAVPLNLLLDIDGTLAITDRLYLLAFQDLMRPFGYTEVDEVWFEKHVAGKVDAEVFRALLRPSRLTDSEYEAECARPEAAAAEEAAEQSEGETGADASLRNTLLAPPPRSRM